MHIKAHPSHPCAERKKCFLTKQPDSTETHTHIYCSLLCLYWYTHLARHACLHTTHWKKAAPTESPHNRSPTQSIDNVIWMFNFKALEINTDFLTGTKYIFLPNNDGLLQEKKIQYVIGSVKRDKQKRETGVVFFHMLHHPGETGWEITWWKWWNILVWLCVLH